jgi:hypothetical protein
MGDKKPLSQTLAMCLYLGLSTLFTLFIHWNQDIRHKLVLKTLLMPSLALWVYRKHGGKAFNEVRPMYRGLFCATLGDFFLDFHQYKGNQGPWFIIGMLSFLLM